MRSSVTGSAQTLVFLDQPSYPRLHLLLTLNLTVEIPAWKNYT